jgi:hypothetical protein
MYAPRHLGLAFLGLCKRRQGNRVPASILYAAFGCSCHDVTSLPLSADNTESKSGQGAGCQWFHLSCSKGWSIISIKCQSCESGVPSGTIRDNLQDFERTVSESLFFVQNNRDTTSVEFRKRIWTRRRENVYVVSVLLSSESIWEENAVENI